jgi:phage tail-like protein
VSGTPFRLLDSRTGWSDGSVEHLTGLDTPEGLRLADPTSVPGAIHVSDLAACLPPARGAWNSSGHVFCAARERLLEWDPCIGLTEGRHLDREPLGLSSLSLGRGIMAIADHSSGSVDLLRPKDVRPVLRLDVSRVVGCSPRLVAITPWSLIAVVTERPDAVALIGFDGILRRRRELPDSRPPSEIGMVCVLGASGEARPELVLSLTVQPGWRRLFRIDKDTLNVVPLDPARLIQPRTSGVEVTVDESGTWMVQTAPGSAVTFDADGEPVDRGPGRQDFGESVIRRFVTEGRLLTIPIDSGLEDCRWHRVRFDADQPPGTSVELRLATMAAPDQSINWQTVDRADSLIRQPPGRFLQLDLRLHGTGTATPVVRRITVDYEASTSIEQLPSVYREEPAAADFTRRFLSLFDASLGDLDDVIEHAPLLFDVEHLADHALSALARLAGIQADPEWPAARLRDLLKKWPEIWPSIGTPLAVKKAVSAVYGIDVFLEELGQHRPWAAIGSAYLGQVRLFGAGRASLRMGTGRLGESRLDPQADPLAPAFSSGAYQCIVHVPTGLKVADRRGVERLVRSFLPGHLTVRMHFAAPSFTIGRRLVVGVSTRLAVLPPGVLGTRGDYAVVLRRRGPLSPGNRDNAAVTVGQRPTAGIALTTR